MSRTWRRPDATPPPSGDLRKLTPRPASYVWETDCFEPNWQDSFWGDNYPRLRAIKQTYDPEGLFFLHHGVGSDDWSPDGFMRLNYGAHRAPVGDLMPRDGSLVLSDVRGADAHRRVRAVGRRGRNGVEKAQCVYFINARMSGLGDERKCFA